MGFKSLIAKQVQSGLKVLGTDTDGLYSKHTYISVGEGAYDPDTRTRTESVVEYENVPMLLARFSLDDMDDDVRPQTDRKAIIASLDLPVTPKGEDKIRLRNDVVYVVRKILKDPSEGLCVIHVRMQ